MIAHYYFRRWIAWFVLSCALGATAWAAGLRYLEGEPRSGIAPAVIVDNEPLAFTGQVFGIKRGEAPVRNAAAQVEAALDNLSALLVSAGSSFDRIVRINAYVADPSITREVEQALARRFPGNSKPTLALMAGGLPVPGALVAMDAVGVSAAQKTAAAVRYQSGAAILPGGPVLFISGRSEPGGPDEAARKTLISLNKDLDFMGLTKRDVVQVKAFVSPVLAADGVQQEIQRFFGADSMPAVSVVEWHNTGRPVEIELVAAAPVRSGEQRTEAVEYLTPIGDKPNGSFTRLVRVNRGKLIYTSGLFGDSDRAPEAETREIFTRLRAILGMIGSDFDHMAKATYYVTDEATSTALNTVRGEIYNPKRPPTASKVRVTGTGREGKTTTLDMIAVAP